MLLLPAHPLPFLQCFLAEGAAGAAGAVGAGATVPTVEVGQDSSSLCRGLCSSSLCSSSPCSSSPCSSNSSSSPCSSSSSPCSSSSSNKGVVQDSSSSHSSRNRPPRCSPYLPRRSRLGKRAQTLRAGRAERAR